MSLPPLSDHALRLMTAILTHPDISIPIGDIPALQEAQAWLANERLERATVAANGVEAPNAA